MHADELSRAVRAFMVRGMRIAPLERSHLALAELVLADACAFDRATEVAEEKLFAPGPTAPAIAFGAWNDNELVGVAAVSSKWLRVIAVVPHARRQGAGEALLAACETHARTSGENKLRVLDQPGNYLAPGVDERNVYAIGWLEKRGYVRLETRENVLIAVRDNPRVTEQRAAELIAKAGTKGYEVRRANPDETALLDAVQKEFGGAWPFELQRALGHDPCGVHVALYDGEYCAFAAHDGNNRGLGWFGPTGTWPAHRGKGLGEAVLMACLVDVGKEHPFCEVAWIGPRPFYDKVAGIAQDRRFIALARNL
jgi:ribosomal protein S18 acetylase RimI-like enzyme